MADSSQNNEGNQPDTNIVPGFSNEQIQQLAKAISMMNQNSSNSDVFANVAGLLSTDAFINFISTKPWILDSGATNHISSEPNFLTHTTLPTIPLVNLPTGSTAPITATGNVNFNKDITLQNVLCVPSFHLNLMSASRLTNALNCCVILLPNGCII